MQIQTRQRGNCSTLAGKSRGGTPFCRTLKIGFSKSSVSYETYKAHCNCSTGTVARLLLIVSGKQGGAVLFAPPRKAVAFLTTPSVCQKHGTGNFAACGQRSGLLALNLASIFEKLLEQKIFICLRLIGCNHCKNNLLRKCGLLAHTSPAFLKNCWSKKLFVCLRLVAYIPSIRK